MRTPQNWLDTFKKNHILMMSNTKWKKVFEAIEQINNVDLCFKRIFSDSIVYESNPTLILLETGLGDCLSGGPLPYAFIEWIMFPVKAFSLKSRSQVYENLEIEQLERELVHKGKFPMEHVILPPQDGIAITDTFVIYDYVEGSE